MMQWGKEVNELSMGVSTMMQWGKEFLRNEDTPLGYKLANSNLNSYWMLHDVNNYTVQIICSNFRLLEERNICSIFPSR